MRTLRVLMIGVVLVAAGCSGEDPAPAAVDEDPVGSTTSTAVFDSGPPASLDQATAELAAAFGRVSSMNPENFSSIADAMAEQMVRTREAQVALDRFSGLLDGWEYAPIGAHQFADAARDVLELNVEMDVAWRGCLEAGSTEAACGALMNTEFEARFDETAQRLMGLSVNLPAGSWDDYP